MPATLITGGRQVTTKSPEKRYKVAKHQQTSQGRGDTDAGPWHQLFVRRLSPGPETRRLLKAGVDVRLRPKSFGVLRVLIERRGELLTKDELLNAVWGQCRCHRRCADAVPDRRAARHRRRVAADDQDGSPPGLHIRRSRRRIRWFASEKSPGSFRQCVGGRRGRPRGARTTPPEFAAAGPCGSDARFAGACCHLVGLDSRGTDAVPPVVRGAAAQVPNNSIAVLPFVNMSSDPGSEYFCDGISEEILNRLAGFPICT